MGREIKRIAALTDDHRAKPDDKRDLTVPPSRADVGDQGRRHDLSAGVCGYEIPRLVANAMIVEAFEAKGNDRDRQGV